MIEATTERLSKDGERNSLTLIPASSSSLYFNVCNVVIFPICEKLLMESHRVIACIVKSKQHIGNPNYKANTCIEIYL